MRACGRQQMSHASHEQTVDWLSRLCRGLPQYCRVFPNLRQMRKLLRVALDALGLSGLGLTLASLRPGGASFLFTTTRNVPAIQFLGRWKQLPSLTHYIQESMSQLVLMSIPEHAQEIMLQLEDEFAFLDCVPPQPWQTFFSRGSGSRVGVASQSNLPLHHHQHGTSRGRLQCGPLAASRRASSCGPQGGPRDADQRCVAVCAGDRHGRRTEPPRRGRQPAVCAEALRQGAHCRARSEGVLGACRLGALHEVESDGTSRGEAGPCEAAGASATGAFFIGSDDEGEEEEDGGEGWTLSPRRLRRPTSLGDDVKEL